VSDQKPFVSVPDWIGLEVRTVGTFAHKSGVTIVIVVQRRQSWWGWGLRPPVFGQGVVGSQRVVDGSWNIIISYYVQEVCSKVLTF